MLEERDEEFCGVSADDERNPLRPLLATLRNWAPRAQAESQDTRDEKLERSSTS